MLNQIFTAFGITAVLCWGVASFCSIKKKEKGAVVFQTVGVLLIGMLLSCLWITLERPPFKTMGETRIWYSFFLAILGGVTYWRLRMGYLLALTNLLAAVFVVITICKPEIQSQVLMPALQSGWFVPHVAVYMFAYAVVGFAVILSFLENRKSAQKPKELITKNAKRLCKESDTLVKIATSALGIGLCFGALWAKKAWGQYWSWDVKESAALITWFIFLLYIHLQKITRINRKILFVILVIGFLSLQFTWYGVKYLPAAQKSPHSFYG